MALPIDSVLPQLLACLLTHSRVVLQAPPGAGKTTRVPLALLAAPWLGQGKIIMLEPRRLATRAAARFMAQRLGQSVGETVGYRVRLDSQVGPKTQIEVVTEGILIRMLQDDPELSGVSAVIFDEFHERNLQADLGLALCLEAQAALREDLRILVMSATLDGAAVSQLLADAPVISSDGRCYPVALRYVTPPLKRGHERASPLDAVTATVINALAVESGSVLVFLPGLAEIKKIESQLRAADLGDDVLLAPLYGNLSQSMQDQAIAPPAVGQRKVVLATNIAETSLTIDGIRIVVDTGLMRALRFEPRTGMSTLATMNISQASADQRCGRAGRLETGVCYRLWPESKILQAQTTAEIEVADLTALVLQLAQWGCTEPDELQWLNPPPAASVAQARDLLRHLGALDRHGRITAHGQQIATLALHPRLAHMLIQGHALGVGALACDLAALLSERDLLRNSLTRDADIHSRLRLLLGDRGNLDRAALARVREVAQQWRRRLSIKTKTSDADLAMAGVLLGLAYPDRIGQGRGGDGQRFLLSNGRGAVFGWAEALAKSEYLVVAQLDSAGKEARIFLAAELSVDDLERYFADQITTAEFVRWESAEKMVLARQQRRLGALILEDKPWFDVDPEQAIAAMLDGIEQMGLDCLPWQKQHRQWQARLKLLHCCDASSWPDVSNEALLARLSAWLGPFLTGISRQSHLNKVDLGAALNALLPWQQQRQLDELAPTHLTVPTGSRIALDYDNDPPILAVRMQEMFGVAETPTVAAGQVRVLLHLLSPARRPLQVTQDLAGFWGGSYRAVKKEMKGRYPKHYWPDDPLQAEPTRRIKSKR